MSFEINWDQLVGDGTINESIKEFLDSQFRGLLLPSYINDLSVKDFSLGSVPPEITIRHIGDPFDEFYREEDEMDGDAAAQAAQSAQLDALINDDDSTDDEDEKDMDMTTSIEVDSTVVGPGIERPMTTPDRPSGLSSRNSSIPFLNLSHNYSMNNVGLHSSHAPTNATPGNPNHPNPGSYAMGAAGIHRSDSPLYGHPYSTLRNLPSNPMIPTILRARESPPVVKSDTDIQLIAEIKYQGDLHIEIAVNLLVNYPSPNFITLPIKLHITDLHIHSIVTIAYLKRAVYMSFLCDIDDTTEGFSTNAFGTNGGNIVDYAAYSGSQLERIDIIKRVRIESEIGEVEQNVLRNVGKVEKFLVEQLRGILRDEVSWPSWICLDMDQTEGVGDEDEEEDDEGESL